MLIDNSRMSRLVPPWRSDFFEGWSRWLCRRIARVRDCRGRLQMRFEQIEDCRILLGIELAREQVGAECQAQGVGGHEGTRAQLDVAVGHPVDRAQIVVHHFALRAAVRSEEHTSELQSLMRSSYAVFCLKKKQT